MKFLNVNATIILKPVFEGDVLKAGTPLALDGSIANSDAAVGLVASDTAKGAESIAVVTEGTIDLTEVAASYGEALTDDCIAALKGITFLYGGKAVVPTGGGGGYLLLTRGDTGAVTGATADEIRAAWTDGTPIFIKWGNAVRPANYVYDEFSDKTYVESEFVQLTQDPEEGLYMAYVNRWRIEVKTSSLGNCASYNERLALYSDLSDGSASGGDPGFGGAD